MKELFREKTLTRREILNKYIHQLIVLKRKRIEEGASKQAIRRVQDKIDDFIRVRDGVRPLEYLQKK